MLEFAGVECAGPASLRAIGKWKIFVTLQAFMLEFAGVECTDLLVVEVETDI